jgi:restriction system protein
VEVVLGLLVLGVMYLAIVHLLAKRQQRLDDERQEAVWKQEEEATERTVDAVIAEMEHVIVEHLETLSRKRQQKRYRDDYGQTVETAWVQEKAYFYKSFLEPITVRHGVESWWLSAPHYEIIDGVLDEYESPRATSDVDVESLSPTDFEVHCASLLEQDGWSASLTRGSGDQGIDVIAERDGVKAVFQCKQSSQPVGNRAVQEAIAGKLFAAADHAFVVTNSTFTGSAAELARAAGVTLIHVTQLTDLAPYLKSDG